MRSYAAGVNPAILVWAREESGYSIEEIAKKFNKNVEEIRNWESGASLPTYIQLEKLAQTYYKRPIAIFFFPEPPDIDDPVGSFRTLPTEEAEKLHPDTRFAIREAQDFQYSLLELTEGSNPSDKKILNSIDCHDWDNPFECAKQARNFFDITIEDQLSWKDHKTALEQWRDRVQDSGVFVFKRSFRDSGVSGFCLKGEEFPVIMINNSTPKSRQIFTLFHELGHLLSDTSGILLDDDEYFSQLDEDDRKIEYFCNGFAANFLVPNDELEDRIPQGFQLTEEKIVELASLFSVSREVILRKLVDLSITDWETYDDFVTQWKNAPRDKGSGGGNFYNNVTTYLGYKYISLVFDRYYAGSLSESQVADYLNAKSSQISEIEIRLQNHEAAQ